MKLIIMIVVVLITILAIVFTDYSPKSSVIAPEIKKTGNYERPVKEGNCYRQKDSTGNSILVCG